MTPLKSFLPDFKQLALGLSYSTWCISDIPLASVEQLRRHGNGCLFATINLLAVEATERSWYFGKGHQYLRRLYIKAVQL